jgi:hypothetical protein
VVRQANAREKAYEKILKNFADENHFSLLGDGPVLVPAPSLLSIGFSQRLTNIVSGGYKSQSVRLYTFNTSFTNDVDDPRSHVSFTVLELAVSKTFPDLILLSRPIRELSNLNIKNKQLLLLEGNFDTYFGVFIDQGTQLPALEIFTPDVMQAMIEKRQHLNIEISGAHLFIYAAKKLTTKSELQSMLIYADFLISYLVPRLEKVSL